MPELNLNWALWTLYSSGYFTTIATSEAVYCLLLEIRMQVSPHLFATSLSKSNIKSPLVCRQTITDSCQIHIFPFFTRWQFQSSHERGAMKSLWVIFALFFFFWTQLPFLQINMTNSMHFTRIQSRVHEIELTLLFVDSLNMHNERFSCHIAVSAFGGNGKAWCQSINSEKVTSTQMAFRCPNSGNCLVCKAILKGLKILIYNQCLQSVLLMDDYWN